MYATVPSVVTLSPAGGIHWTALWADVRVSSTGLPEGPVAMVLIGGLNRKARGFGNRLYRPLEGSDDLCRVPAVLPG
jgi:hypothetical protein